MDLQLKNKTAFISGSTAGIGLAIAKGLAAEDVNVWINGRTQERVDNAIHQIKQAVPNADVNGISADLATAEGNKKITDQLESVDILINNVGIFQPKDFFAIPDNEWQEFFNVNIMSGVRLSRHYLPIMLEKDWGRILFISSESAVNIITV